MPRMKPFLFFSVVLLIKSYLAWLVIFEGKLSWMPLMTEIPFVWLLFCLIEWFASKRKMFYYIGVNLLLTALFFSVIMYYKYYGVIATYHALQQVNQVTAVSNSVFSLLDPQYLFIFLDVVVLGVMLFRRKRRALLTRLGGRRERRAVVTVLFLVSLMLCLLNILPNRASMSERKKAEEMGILNYEAYTLFAKDKPEPVDAGAITQEAIDGLKDVVAPASPQLWQAAAGRNVIVIQLESFQNFLIGLTIDGQEVTPVMNRLAHDNYYFPRFYQQVGQGNTSDAEFVVNTSLYIPPHGAATMSYADKELPSLPKLLKRHGYRTATFHTNVVEFWNRGALYEAIGFDRYYDKDFFGTSDPVFFGSSDEVLYDKTADELARLNEDGAPFYAQVISMTAHHPFTIPKEKQRLTLPERYEGTFVGDYVRAQNYADYALGLFIDKLQENGVWDDSLIVVYGDHLGLPVYSLDADDKELLKEIYGHKYGYAEMVNIPLVIASPGITSSARFDQVGGQIDLLPTIANLTGVPLDVQLHFGQDLLNQTANLLPERYYLPSGSFINDKAVFIPGNGYDDGVRYPLAGGDNASSSALEAEYERALQLLRYSDNYVLQLPDRVPQRESDENR